MKKNSYFYGIYAELFIVLLLRCCFYKIIARRYRNFFGEIDIIASKNKTIVFIEVKARKRFVHFELLSKKQIHRIIKSAKCFIATKNYNRFAEYQVRFDVVYVFGFLRFHYIKNAWNA